MFTVPLLFNIILEALANAISKGKKWGIQFGKCEAKLSADDMYLKNTRESIEKLSEMREFS